MILFFSDTHLGLKSYSTQNEDGIFSSEIDCLNVLETIYEKAKSPEITMLIHGGDTFHNPHPTTKNVKHFINWLNKIEELGKPFYIITGNHCVTNYSHSLVFIKELNYKNIHLIDIYDKDAVVTFGKYKIKLVPYIMNLSSKEKDVIAHSNFTECMQESEDNTIIISHIQESSCRVGSEMRLISKSVDIISAESNKNLIVILGHIHTYQQYVKGNTKICYSGSPYGMDVTDSNIDKGYILINENGEITFEQILNIRKFIKHQLTKGEDVIEYFQNKRLPIASVNFVEYYEDFDTTKLYEIFKLKEISMGWIHKIKEIKLLSDNIEIETNNVDNYTMFKTYIEKKYKLLPELKYKDEVISNGINFMNRCIGKFDE
jgi:DNA repair exonuclease SbcCD nuclease subunit